MLVLGDVLILFLSKQLKIVFDNARSKAVALARVPELYEQTFLKIARADAIRVECLNDF